MKKCLLLLICLFLLLPSAGLAAARSGFTMPREGTVLQNEANRHIRPTRDALELNRLIPGESPTTGLPADTTGRYMPMLVQISNPEGSVTVMDRKIKAAGVGTHAPWGGQYADIVYEGVLYRNGYTRITFLYNDSFAKGLPDSAGPVRSARIGHVLLREEWGGGIVYAGGPRVEENNISAMFYQLGASDKGVAYNILDGKYLEFKYRVKGVRAPDNYNVNPAGLRTLVPETTVAYPHPFLFADESPYTEGYAFAHSVNLDWGQKNYISHFYYDEGADVYLRYSGDAPYKTYVNAEDRSPDHAIQMSFSNVIIQRVEYEYAKNNGIMPVMQSVGRGNADIFIGGRYIPGYWVRESIESPTVFLDDQGNEIILNRGKTFIAHFPPESLLTFQGIQ